MIPAPDCFEPEWLETGGARLRAARFAADPARPPKGVCVVLNGQTEFIEKYFEVIDKLRQRGFAVAAMDWRGQGGSGRMADNPLKAHIGDFSQYDDDLENFMARVVRPMLAPGTRPIGLAHSMGGHLLLRYLHRHPENFAAAAFSAPMLQFSARGLPHWLVQAIARGMTALGHGTDFVWGMHRRDPVTLAFSRQIVTSDPARFRRAQDFLKQHPDLRLGGPTWGWVAAASRAIAEMNAPGYAETITTPVLICGASEDQVVISEASRRFAARLPDGVYQPIEGAQHEILMERDVFRQQFWRAFDAFMDKHI
jgi:lysophospholipase